MSELNGDIWASHPDDVVKAILRQLMLLQCDLQDICSEIKVLQRIVKGLPEEED